MWSESERHEGSTLRDYLRVVRRRKWLIAQAVLLVPLAAILFSLQQQHLYRGSAEVLLSRQNLAAILTNTPDQTAGVQPDRIAQTQADLARVPTVARNTLRALHLTDRTPEDFLNHSSVSPKTNADLLVFTVTDPVARLASSLASEYAHQFKIYRERLDTAALDRARAGVEQKIAQLERVKATRSPLYASLVEKDQQLRTMGALQTSNAFVVRAAGAAGQIQPRPTRNGILGLLLGLVLGIGLAFLWEALDTRVRSADEINTRLGVALLGRLPIPSKRFRADNRLVMLEEPHAPEAEAFRMLRTSLEFANLDRGAKTIMVTSAVESEGKTTTIANLAVALAKAGKRVLVVDLDLRRPRLHRFFGLPDDQKGITNVVLGELALEDAVTVVFADEPPPSAAGSNGHGRGQGVLKVLPAGTPPPDPGEFLATQALADTVRRLRDQADVVLMDAPPLLHVGDTMSLSTNVDALVLVTRLQALRRPMLAELKRQLETSPAPVLGYVVTGAQLEDDFGYATYRYYGAAPAPMPQAEEPVA